jgi:hypothetical protein
MSEDNNDEDNNDEDNSDIFSSDDDSDFDEEYDFDTENLASIERICDDDYFDSLHISKKRYIGIALNQNDYYLYLLHITPNSYFKYPHDIVRRYLRRYSCVELPKGATVEIIEMIIENVAFNGQMFSVKKAILKTHWIRLIQRCWRNTLKKRNEMIIKWGSQRNRIHVELTGKNLPEYRYMPGLRGCMCR